MKSLLSYPIRLLSLLLLSGALPLSAFAQSSGLQFYRPHDQRGIDVFEPPKEDTVAYDGFRLDWGAAFAQQFQGLTHSNDAEPNIVDGVDQNARSEPRLQPRHCQPLPRSWPTASR